MPSVGVLDPKARPTLRLPVGSYALNLEGATEPWKLAVPRIDLRQGGRQVVRVVRNIPPAPTCRAPEPAPPIVVAPFSDADVRRIAARPAAEQVEEVRKELMRRNPSFDGKVTHKIQDGVVTEFRIVADWVIDISPIRVWSTLWVLSCRGTQAEYSRPDLTLLAGMNLAGLNSLDLSTTRVSDAGMAHFKDCKNLEKLILNETQISDAGLVHFRDCNGSSTTGGSSSRSDRSWGATS